ncbi:MAG TPA: glycosyltransferase family 39 protein [Anaerolineales bacterium]|nr:glycosyltransferase family 39 protein [Anaerolineales bacterium]
MSSRVRLFILALSHLAALALAARLAHWPYPLVIITLALANLPFHLYSRAISRTPPRPLWSLEVGIRALLAGCAWGLAPLYAVTALRILIALITRALCPTCYTYLAVPEPFASILSFEWTGIFCLTAIIVLKASQTFPPQYHTRLATFALAALAALWILIFFPRLIPAGVTGADPFAYVQMGVDLATRGTPMHHFPLAGLARGLNIPIYPTLFVGYTIPHNGDSATVWPPGFSALLAIAFRLFGERGLYILNPILGILCAAATYFLARRIFNLPPFFSLFAAALLLTSFEQTIRLSIPLADLAVQLFTALAITVAFGLASDASNREIVIGNWRLEIGFLEFGICGFLLALAFVARYTQLLLVPGILVALLARSRQLLITSYRLRITLFASVFILTTFPDTLYRATAFGSPFSFAAGELSKFSAADVLPVTLRLLTELAADFNFAAPFVIIGVIYLIRHHRSTAIGLALILGPAVLFHLPYHYLKLRDLLFLFPTLCALAALGLHRLSSVVRRPSSSLFILHCSLFIVLAFRFNAQFPLIGGFYTYGFLNTEQRAHIDSIANLTPPNAVIAASLNSGSISLYANRDTIRPGHLLQPGRTWTDEELITFVNALRAESRPLYLLMDSEEMTGPADVLRKCCHLVPIAELYLPYYYHNGAAANKIITLYRVDYP